MEKAERERERERERGRRIYRIFCCSFQYSVKLKTEVQTLCKGVEREEERKGIKKKQRESHTCWRLR